MSSSNLKFIKYLDNFDTSYSNVMNEVMLKYWCYNNYFENHSKLCIKQGNSFYTEQSNGYYDYFSNSQWNTSIKENGYDNWTKKNKYILPSFPEPGTSSIVEKDKEKKTIHTEINSVKDLLKIINDNPYEERYSYNIDLKRLHNIKLELTLLDGMIGMDELKSTIIDQLLYFIQRLDVSSKSTDFKHTVIYGPPGTGKTEIAKIIGRMYSKLGILEKNIFKKVTRSDLVAGYLGQTAMKTTKVIEECMGGVLFIDEAYSLADTGQGSSDSYSKECIDTLCEALSDHKEKLMVIIAGYKEELDNTFFRVNKGMNSRFIWRFNIESYTPIELKQIFEKQMSEQEWVWDDSEQIDVKWFESKKEQFTFYGRDMESLFTYVKVNHGRRIYGKDNSVKKRITMDDLDKGYSMYKKNKCKKEKNMEHLHMMYM